MGRGWTPLCGGTTRCDAVMCSSSRCDRVQVDVNVVTEGPSGLVTPVVRNVQVHGLRHIAKELEALEASGYADSSKLQMGTFSIHDLG